METRLCICSLDTVALVGRTLSLDALRQTIVDEGGVTSYIQLKSYGRNDWFTDGTRLATGFKGSDPTRVRIELFPSRVDYLRLSQLLALLSELRVHRVDIAIDYVGYDIQCYVFYCTRLGLSRHILSRNAFPHSFSFGEGDSHRRIAVYDKIEKCRADRIREVRLVDVAGEIHSIPVWKPIDEDSGWFRVEARLKGHWILDGATPRPGVFDDLIVHQRLSSSLGLDLRTEATLEFISRNPEAIRRLGRNSRPKYRRLLRRLEHEHGLIPHPADVYRDNYELIGDALRRILASGSSADGGRS